MTRGRRPLGVPACQDDPPRGKRSEKAKRAPTSRSSSGSMASATSRARNQATGYVAKGRPKAPAQTVVAITSGSTERSLAARGDRSDFAGYSRRPRTEPRHSGRSTRWSGRGRKLETSSRRCWMQGMGQPSPPRPSGDGTKMLWMAIYGRSKGWREWNECGLAMGREQSWSPDCWRLRRLTSRRALLRPSCWRHAWWKKWARCPQWYDRPTGVWSWPSSCKGPKRTGPLRRSGRRSTTSSESAMCPEACRTGRLSPWHACQWGTACDAQRQGALWDKGGRASSFWGQSPEGGGQQQELGPWGREWLQFLVKLRALKGFHPDRGAWHGSGEALGKTLVRLLKQGGGGKRRPGGTLSGDWGRHNSSTWVPWCKQSCSGVVGRP